MLLHVAALGVFAALGQLRPAVDVYPFTVESPSKAWRAQLTPSERDGKGPSDLVIEHDGAKVATATFAFTFDAAAITDEGFVVGYGRTGSLENKDGVFIVSVVGPDGVVVRDDRFPQSRSRSLHGSPDPRPRGLLVDPLGRWFVIRIADPDANGHVETWWRFAIAATPRREELVPHASMGPSFDAWLDDAKVIPDTQWFIVNWRVADRDDRGPRVSGAFTVIDRTGAVLWRLDLPNDYTSPPDDSRAGLAKLTPILGVGPGPRFALWHVLQRDRVEYRVDISADADARVIEESRTTFGNTAISKATRTDGIETPDSCALPTRRLAQIAAIPLLGAEPLPAVPTITDFDFDAGGSPIAIRSAPWGRFTSVLYDAKGGVDREVAWEPLPSTLADGDVRLHALGAGRWLLSAYTKSNNERGWFIVDAHDGKLNRLATLAARVESARGTRDGGFVALISRGADDSDRKNLVRCDHAGQVCWEVAHGNKSSPLYDADEVTVLADGAIAVLENWPRNDVRLFDDAGQLLTTIDLAKTFGEEPNYVSTLHAEPDGGFFLEDSHGGKTTWRITRDGDVTASFTPRRTSAHEPAALSRNARPGPDGTAWTHDYGALYVLDSDGVIARTIGPELDDDALAHPYQVAIDSLGRTWIHDQRSDAQHGFDANGRKLWIAKFAPDDGALESWRARVLARPDGGILVERYGEVPAVRFDANGVRLGRAPGVNLETFIELTGERFVASTYRQPLTILDASGAVIARHKTMPDGKWAERPDAATWTADGRAALIVSKQVVFLDADGKPERSIPLPRPIKSGFQLSWNGDHVLVGQWPSALLYSFESNAWEIVTIADDDPKTWGVLGLTSDGDALLAVDQQDHVLWKFALK